MIQIKPIFNQSQPNIWSEFAAIRLAAWRITCKYDVKASDGPDLVARWKVEWESGTNNFAFAAYDGARMVGFIRGNIRSDSATVEDLYVLPRYQGRHIGGQLLSAARSAVSLNTKNMDLISMASDQALSFYKKNGFVRFGGLNNMVLPSIRPATCQTVPVFSTLGRVSRQFNAVANMRGTKFNRKAVADKHLPTFAYVDENANVLGFVTADVAPLVATHANVGRISGVLVKKMTEMSR